MTISADEKDWLLEKIVVMINGTENELPITLAIEGTFVTGALISYHRFLNFVKASIIPNNPDILADKFLYCFDVRLKAELESMDDDGGWNRTAYYIHLKNAKFHDGKGEDLSKQTGVNWRGQIDKVSGFNLGSIPQVI